MICTIKKCVLLNWYSSMKKELREIRMIFLCRQLALKVKFWPFLTPPHYTNSQNSLISVDCSWFLGKNISNFEPPAWKLDNPYYHDVHFVWTFSECKSQSFLVNGSFYLLNIQHLHWLWIKDTGMTFYSHWLIYLLVQMFFKPEYPKPQFNYLLTSYIHINDNLYNQMTFHC